MTRTKHTVAGAAFVATLTLALGGTAALVVGRGDEKPAGNTDLKKLEGTWTVVEMERAGEKATAEERKGMLVTIKDGSLVIESPAGPSQPFKIHLDASKTPKHIDLTGPAESEPLLGIYELDGDKLKLGLGNMSKPNERQKEFKTSPETPGSRLLILERQK